MAERRVGGCRGMAERRMGWCREMAERRIGWCREMAERRNGGCREMAERRMGWCRAMAERRMGWCRAMAERRMGWCREMAERRMGWCWEGPNGVHVCMVFEVLGCNLLKLIIKSNYRGIPLENVRTIIRQVQLHPLIVAGLGFFPDSTPCTSSAMWWARGLGCVLAPSLCSQVLEGLHYLHTKCQIIHTDIKPENVLLTVDDAFVRKMAYDATQYRKLGLKLPASFVSTAPKEYRPPEPSTKMSKNKKKKLRKKEKKKQELLDAQMRHICELEEKAATTPGEEPAPEDITKAGVSPIDQEAPPEAPAEPENNPSAAPAEENGEEVVGTKVEDEEEPKPEVAEAVKGPELSEEERKEVIQRMKIENRKSFAEMTDATVVEGPGLENGPPSLMVNGNLAMTASMTGESLAIGGLALDDFDGMTAAHSNASQIRRTASLPDQVAAQNALAKFARLSVSGEKKAETDVDEQGVPASLTAPLKRPDPSHEVCDMNVKIADLGNACWVVSYQGTPAGHPIEQKGEWISLPAPSHSPVMPSKSSRASPPMARLSPVMEAVIARFPLTMREGGPFSRPGPSTTVASVISAKDFRFSIFIRWITSFLSSSDNSGPFTASATSGLGSSSSSTFVPTTSSPFSSAGAAEGLFSGSAGASGGASWSMGLTPAFVMSSGAGSSPGVVPHHHHFTEDIQTRQYRCLEVLLGAGYGTPADIWSTACMAFELATGDYLFEPHSGENYTRDEDHLAHIIELMGEIPRHIAFSGKYSREFFNKKGELRHIQHLKPWGITDVLMEKYEWSEADAQDFATFLLPMLAYDPNERATALDCLMHPWLNK
ncbi:unnamed protein product [Cyprideis torosa]|uniref:non-specific serine/threonine protein kinase n=1 Tax=Cyprideis torosa TaxID=163714 RepID=A0A7R8WHL6_9CRUS|nr:unnamed protein product [Cyprideis torosa]CAG0899486.1 unnamed protein product [Cyprideis torosa]